MENKKIRNPFPAIGKVFKYEFLNSFGVLLPLYAVLWVISLLTGIFVLGDEVLKGQAGSVVQTVLVIAATVIFIASFVLTLMFLEKRFQKGMLGDEAYLNLSLPVTLGEHVWGRALLALVWALIYAVVVAVALLLLCVQSWGSGFFDYIFQYLREYKYMTGASFVPSVICMCTSLFLLIILFCYVVNAIGHLVKKGRKFVEVVVAVVIVTLLSSLGYRMIDLSDATISYVFWFSSIMNVVYAIVFGVATQLILHFKLNLE